MEFKSVHEYVGRNEYYIVNRDQLDQRFDRYCMRESEMARSLSA